MQTFRYFPPGVEEQRAFAMQFLGTLLGLALIVGLWVWQSDPTLRGMLGGAAVAMVWMLGHAAWQLETKARRAQNAAIGVDETGLALTDATGQTRRVGWGEISRFDMQGGRLVLEWPGGRFVVGARELENGMMLLQELQRRAGRDAPPSNFIPLEPK